jgi:hypothetical protein
MDLFPVFQGDGSDSDGDGKASAPAVLPSHIQKQTEQKQMEYLKECLKLSSKRMNHQLHLFIQIDFLKFISNRNQHRRSLGWL